MLLCIKHYLTFEVQDTIGFIEFLKSTTQTDNFKL
jgi:hypothetical protein